MRSAKRFLFGLAWSLLSALPCRADLINGSLEPEGPSGPYFALPGGSSAIPGWITVDSGVEWFRPDAFGAGFAADGLYVVDLANLTFSAGGIAQLIATTPGLKYVVTFQIGTTEGSGRDGTAEIVVSADTALETFAVVNHGPTLVWEGRSFSFTADDSSATLAFRCLQDANRHFADLDAIELHEVTTSVPYPPLQASAWGTVKRLFTGSLP